MAGQPSRRGGRPVVGGSDLHPRPRRKGQPRRDPRGGARALEGESEVYTTGLVLQELLQGFSGPVARESIVARFASLPLIVPTLEDHAEAAAIGNACRREGVQVGTIDALIARLAVRFDLALLTTDRDFRHMARHVRLALAT